MKKIFSLVILICLAQFLFWGCGKKMVEQNEIDRQSQKNLILINANIFTLDKDTPRAEALIISEGKIIFIGNSKEALRHRNPNSELIDLKGNTVIPGLVDAHAHFFGFGEMLGKLDLRETNSLEEILELVKNAKAKIKKGDWIIGRGWDQNKWEKKDFPDNAKLNKITPENPVYLTRVDGHAALVNRMALEKALINKETKTPSGGKIVRSASGEPTGLLVDNAITLIDNTVPPLTVSQIKEAILRAQESCLKVGLTEVHDAGIDEKTFDAYMELGREGKLKMKIYAMVDYSSDFYEKALKLGPQTSLFNGKFTLRTVKLYADGALGSRGALLSDPYSDDPKNSGLLLTPIEKMKKVVKESTLRGFQVATHAIGDRANKLIIDIYEEVSKELKPKDPRFRVEHVQVIQPSDIKRMKNFNFIASMQPTHCTSDMPWAASRLGNDRIKWGYTWKSILNDDVHLAFGSDFPVESNDPLLGIYAAVTRQDKSGNPKGGFYPEEKLSIYEAVEGFTKGAAYASFQENFKGTIKVGYAADLTVLSKDIFKISPQEILDTKVVLTIVDGNRY